MCSRIADEEFAPIVEELDKLEASLTDQAEPWRDPVARALDERSVAEWLSGLEHVDATACRRYAAGIRGEFMVEPEELSLASLVLEHAGTAGDRPFTRFTMGTAARLRRWPPIWAPTVSISTPLSPASPMTTSR